MCIANDALAQSGFGCVPVNLPPVIITPTPKPPTTPVDPPTNPPATDCTGKELGTAFVDNCGKCVGGDTKLPACKQDCNNEWGGTAYYDLCGTCVGGTTGKMPCQTCIGMTVKFTETAIKQYGFDDYSVPGIPWKSLQKGLTDSVMVSVLPSTDTSYKRVFFKSASYPTVYLDPSMAPAAQFHLKLMCLVNKGTSEVQANCKSVDGSNIAKMNVVAYDSVIKTVAVRLVHSKSIMMASYAGFTSTDVSDAAILSYLNSCYKQANVRWVIKRNPAMTISFDINRDGKLDTQTWMSPEMAIIRDSCKDLDPNIQNLFLVDNGSYPGGTGFSDISGKYSYVHANISLNPSNTITHELGHATFGLIHSPTQDSDNIMYYKLKLETTARLRKGQWDQMHP